MVHACQARARRPRRMRGTCVASDLARVRTDVGWGPRRAEPAFVESVAVGHDFGDHDLSTMARLGQGMCLVMQGQCTAGITLLDEVMVGVTSGEVSPMFAGIAYCTVIAGLLRDLRSASRQRMDRRAHTLVRRSAWPRHVSRKLFGPSVRDHAAARRLERCAGSRRAGVRSPLWSGQMGLARLGLLPGGRAAAASWRVREGRGKLPQGQRSRTSARAGSRSAPASAGTCRRGGVNGASRS
jgi:hypothetical protein